MQKPWKIAFYVSTVLLSAGMLLGGYFDTVKAPAALQAFTHLGYPAYFSVIIGVAKILGVIGIWQTKVRFLREWAYAGFCFDLVGALVSHWAVGDAFAQHVPALVNLGIFTISYALFRKLGFGVSEGRG